MQRKELVHQLRVGDGRRIEDDLDRFAVAGLAGADLAVRWRVCLATGIADTRRTYAPEPLKGGLRGPESAERKVCDLRVAASGVNSVLGGHLGRFAMFGAHAGSGLSFLSNSGARVAVSSTAATRRNKCPSTQAAGALFSLLHNQFWGREDTNT